MTDEDSFDEFYRSTSRRLLRYAYGISGDAAEAQDLVHEAYTRAWQRWRVVSGYDDAEAWLRLVVTRLATDWRRRLGVRRLAAAAARPPLPAQAPSDDTVVLVAAMRTLPVAQRRALALHYLLDRPLADIAAETGASVGTVKSWLSRGRTALSTALGGVFFDEEPPADPAPADQIAPPAGGHAPPGPRGSAEDHTPPAQDAGPGNPARAALREPVTGAPDAH